MFCFDYEGAPGIRTVNQGRQLKLEDLRPETTLRGIVADAAVTGRYQQAELAADLWQVKLGEGSDEYPNPREFLRRVILVGNPVTKPDGTQVRTLWGELAHQLGGRHAFERLRADDERATSPAVASGLSSLLPRRSPNR